MVPWRRPAALFSDQTLDIDQGNDLLGIRAFQVRQQARQGAVAMALTRLGFQIVLRGRNDVAPAVNQVCAHVRRNNTCPEQVLVTRCPHGGHVFASLRWHTAMGCSLAAMAMTMDDITQEDASQGHTVGRTRPKKSFRRRPNSRVAQSRTGYHYLVLAESGFEAAFASYSIHRASTPRWWNSKWP